MLVELLANSFGVPLTLTFSLVTGQFLLVVFKNVLDFNARCVELRRISEVAGLLNLGDLIFYLHAVALLDFIDYLVVSVVGHLAHSPNRQPSHVHSSVNLSQLKVTLPHVLSHALRVLHCHLGALIHNWEYYRALHQRLLSLLFFESAHLRQGVGRRCRSTSRISRLHFWKGVSFRSSRGLGALIIFRLHFTSFLF